MAQSDPTVLGRRWGRVAICCAVLASGFVVVYAIFVRTREGQTLDISSFGAVAGLRASLGDASSWVRDGAPLAVAALVAVLWVVAAERRRWRSCSIAVAVVVVSVLLARLLKVEVLDRPYLGNYGYTVNTFPGGHVAVMASLMIAFLVLVPVSWRSLWLTFGSAAVIVAASMANVITYAHRPSDVFGSILVVGFVATPLLTLHEPVLRGWHPLGGGILGVTLAAVSVVLFALLVNDHVSDGSWARTMNAATVSGAAGLICAVYSALAWVAVPRPSRG